MGDYTNMSLWVPKVPEGFEPLIRAKFEEYSNGSNHYTDDFKGGELRIGANDIRCGSTEELAADLLRLINEGEEDVECPKCKGEGVIDADGLANDDRPCPRCHNDSFSSGYVTMKAPDFAFEVYEDPKYEWLGSIYMHTPGADDFLGECDADGQVVINATVLIELVNQAESLDALRTEIAKRTGTFQRSALRAPEDPR